MEAYEISLEAASEQVIARCARLEEFFTHGDSEADVMAAAEDAMITVLHARMAERQDIPAGLTKAADIRRARGRLVQLTTLQGAKLALYREMRKQTVTKAELARRMGWTQKQADRILDLRHASRMDQIDGAMAALGKRLMVMVQAA